MLFVATTTNKQFTLDTYNWFSEGQYVDLEILVNNEPIHLSEARVSCVHDINDGKIAFASNNKLTIVSYEDIVSIKSVNRRQGYLESKFSSEDKCLGTRDINGITFDNNNWYYEGQTVNIVANNKIYENALIEQIYFSHDRNILLNIKIEEMRHCISSEDIDAISYVERRRKFAYC